jgi:hypothetical protein
MADYRFAAQVISRSQGRSVTAAAAYRSASVIADARSGEIHDYTRKTGVESTEVMAPEYAPAWVHDREKLWNMVEQKEIRKDAQLAREVQLSLPHELNFEQRQALVRDFVQREFVGRGMVADIAMHKPDRGGDQRNFHVHILLTTRDIGPEGFGKKNRDWNSREELTAMRAAWADVQNAHLRQHLGPEAPQVTHLSYADRGVEKVPTIHLGPIATGMERQGMETVLGDYNRDAARRNQSIRHSRERMAEIENTLERRATRSFGYVANEAKLEAKKAIDEKRAAENSLQNILARKKALSAATSPKSLEAQVLRETRIEIRELKKRMEATKQQGRSLRKKVRSISLWVTNPARMIWLKIAELHQRDRLEAALRIAEARLTIRRDWLESREGKTWMEQNRRSPDLRGLRTEERQVRRHIRAAERRVNQALGIAKEAEGLKTVLYGRSNVPAGIDLPESPTDSRKYLAAVAAQLQATQQGLPQDLRRKLAQELSKGRGLSR